MRTYQRRDFYVGPPAVPPDPTPVYKLVDDWGLGDCLKYLGIEGEGVDKLIECLSWPTIGMVLDDLRNVIREEGE